MFVIYIATSESHFHLHVIVHLNGIKFQSCSTSLSSLLVAFPFDNFFSLRTVLQWLFLKFSFIMNQTEKNNTEWINFDFDSEWSSFCYCKWTSLTQWLNWNNTSDNDIHCKTHDLLKTISATRKKNRKQNRRNLLAMWTKWNSIFTANSVFHLSSMNNGISTYVLRYWFVGVAVVARALLLFFFLLFIHSSLQTYNFRW